MKKIAWLVPSPLEGSGGHRTIFQNAEYLKKLGYDIDLYIESSQDVNSDNDARKFIEKYFWELKSNIYNGFDVKDKYDLIFATAWYTAKIVRNIPQKCIKAYFIQDFEAYFNPMGDGYLLAENSYGYGLKSVTIGKWLTHKLKQDFNAESNYFDFLRRFACIQKAQ